MNCIKISFIARAPNCDEEDISSLMWDYLGCLYKNGQILKDYLLVKSVNGYINCLIFGSRVQTGIPSYYYLFNHRKTATVCPSCGGNWKLTGDKTFIAYKCNKCRLVADEVSN